MSPPPIEIDWNIVDDFLIAGSSGTEVAAFFGMAPDTLKKNEIDITKDYGN